MEVGGILLPSPKIAYGKFVHHFPVTLIYIVLKTFVSGLSGCGSTREYNKDSTEPNTSHFGLLCR